MDSLAILKSRVDLISDEVDSKMRELLCKELEPVDSLVLRELFPSRRLDIAVLCRTIESITFPALGSLQETIAEHYRIRAVPSETDRQEMKSYVARVVDRWEKTCLDLSESQQDLEFPLALEALHKKLRHILLQKTEITLADIDAARATVVGASHNKKDSSSTVFRSDGDGWHVEFDGREAHFARSVGMNYLQVLLASPGKQFDAMDLVHLIDKPMLPDGARPALSHAGGKIDRKSYKAARERISELELEIELAHDEGHYSREEELQEEKNKIERYLAEAKGIFGRDRMAGDPAESARQRGTAAIRRALKSIAKKHPALSDHLTRSIKTGLSFAYMPDRPIEWSTT